MRYLKQNRLINDPGFAAYVYGTWKSSPTPVLSFPTASNKSTWTVCASNYDGADERQSERRWLDAAATDLGASLRVLEEDLPQDELDAWFAAFEALD